jgi:hypothetical protein
MAILLEIDNGDGRGLVDYTRYVASPEQSPPTLRDRINQPALLDWGLVSADASFVVPRRSAYVRLSGRVGNPAAGASPLAGAIFTGLITSEPAADFLGVAEGRAVHGWRCQATSEEYLLNVKRVGLLPPFLNQTAGGILTFLAEHLLPGRFDHSSVADGPLIPYFSVQADALWSNVARHLAERAGYFYRVLEGAIIFQPIGAEPAGIVIDESDRHFRPESLALAPLASPIHNDVTLLGATEPQAFVKEYFAGDGFTSRFALSAAAFGAQSQRLLADDFTGAAFDPARWNEADPASALSLFQGRLNVTGGTGTLGETYLLAQQAIELGGELELIHGEFEFVSPSRGILGGLYGDAALAPADCLLGFEISQIAETSRIRAVSGGVVQAPEVQVDASHHYILTTRLSADQPFRTEQVFSSAAAAHGGAAISANARGVLSVRAIDLAHPAQVTETVLYETTTSSFPAFAFYAPVNAADLHVAANFLQVTRPIQASLETQKAGGPAQLRRLGFGIAAHDATITADPHSNQWALEFYEDTIPERGERITLTYRASGRALARVTDSASISAEAALAGDDGRRAVLIADATPQPRTSAEAELAALAYLDEHTVPRSEGTYSTWAAFTENFPRAGARVQVLNESRQQAFTALVRGVTSELREAGGEHILHTLDLGQPSRFEDLLRRFTPAENVLQSEEDAVPVVQERNDIGAAFIGDAPGFVLASYTPEQFTVDMGAPPPAGGSYEVRRSDQGWSSGFAPGSAQNLLGTFTTQSFALPRSGSGQVFYIRPVAATGETSRYSSVLAVHYPPVPAAPAAVLVEFGRDEQQQPIITATVEIQEAAMAGIDAVELRDGSTLALLARWSFGQLEYSGGKYRARFTQDNSVAVARAATFLASAQNALGEFSPARSGSGAQAQPLKPSLSPGNSVGQILEVLLDTGADEILETQVQAAPPSGSFGAPSQDILLPGQPQKFSFVAAQSGGWAFRARRRDALGWSPWSDEAQGQIPPQTLVFAVQFFHADELDPSIGAAINGQNLLPNSEFFLGGIAGQEGTHVARTFALVAAAADGSEVDYSGSSNEMQWKPAVNFADANPGFRSKLSNLGRLLNPGEAVTFSAALRHSGTGGFPRAVRLALRSASNSAYDQTREVPAGSVTSAYRWYSGVFALPANQAVPDDLAVEITVVIAAGQSLASALFCDKVILNRGHRPAAFSLAPWDVLPLAWNSASSAYDLPASIAGGTPRASDPGNAGLLAGTGTEDLDPDFLGRYTRLAS